MPLTPEHRQILDFLRAYGRISYDLLARRLPPDMHEALTDVWRDGLVREYRPRENPAAVYLEAAE